MADDRGELYDNWGRYADGEAEKDEFEEKARTEAEREKLWAEKSKPSHIGYEFRKGHKTQFPDCSTRDNENDVISAFHVAQERRHTGVEEFKTGGVWHTQQAVECWGQGVLALERLKNLRKYRPVLPEPLDAKLGNEGDPAADAAAADLASQLALRAAEPSAGEVSDLVVVLRLNIAQALLNLRDFESCVPHCDKALELDPDNCKGLWRKAKAVWGIRNPGLAKSTLLRLLELEPANLAARGLLQEIDAQEAKKKERRTGVKGRRNPNAAKTTKPGDWQALVSDALGTTEVASGQASEEEELDTDEDERDDDRWWLFWACRGCWRACPCRRRRHGKEA